MKINLERLLSADVTVIGAVKIIPTATATVE
jgi:hypothetical protein